MLQRFTCFLILGCCLWVTNADAQTEFQEKVDLLFEERLYEEAIQHLDQELSRGVDTENIWVLQYRSTALLGLRKWDQAVTNYERVLHVADSLKLRKVQGEALSDLLSLLSTLGRRSEAHVLCVQNLANKDLTQTDIALLRKFHANWLAGQSQLDSALYYHEHSIGYFRSVGDTTNLISSLNDVALVFRRKGDLPAAVETMQQGYQIVLETSEEYLKSRYEATLADFYLGQLNLRFAEDYASLSLERASKLGYDLHAGLSHRILGEIAEHKEEHRVALRHFHQCLELLGDQGREHFRLVSLGGISDVLLALGQLDSARMFIQRARMLVPVVNASEYRHDYFVSEVKLALNEKDLNGTKRWLDSLLNIPFSGMVRSQMKINQLFMRFEYLKGDYARAIKYFDKMQFMRDSLFKIEQSRTAIEMENRFQKAVKEKQIASLDSEKRIKEIELEQKNDQLIYGSAAVSALALLGIFAFSQWRTIRHSNLAVSERNEKISEALGEKDLLLREIHHRVKNNLQVISSLLSIQSRHIADETALQAVNESRNRVKSMALIHQNLYKEEDLTGIDIQDYINKLTRSLVKNYSVGSGEVKVETDVQAMVLDVDTTIPLGLIINELLTNALKYAFPFDKGGKVLILLHEMDGELHLVVKDNGVGFDADSPPQGTGFGMKMIRTFSKKLQADHSIEQDSGTVIRLKIKNYKKA